MGRPSHGLLLALAINPAAAGAEPSATAGGAEDFLACVRRAESHGDYAAVNRHGYYGAYQFNQTTWNATARHAGRPDLVGVRPDAAPAPEQDFLASQLLAWLGKSPWHDRCR